MKNLINANIFARSYELMIRQNESYFFAFDIFDSCLHRDTSRKRANMYCAFTEHGREVVSFRNVSRSNSMRSRSRYL